MDREAARRRVAAIAAGIADQVRRADPAIPPELSEREAQAWRPLLAVAEAIGPSCAAEAREIVLAFAHEGPSLEQACTAWTLIAIYLWIPDAPWPPPPLVLPRARWLRERLCALLPPWIEEEIAAANPSPSPEN